MENKLEIKPEYKPKSIRSFVLRAGRMTEGQRSAFDDHWPQYGLSLFDGPLDAEKAFANANALVLEIGFGMGDSLLTMAKAEPHLNFIGIEVHPPGVGRLVNTAHKDQVQNIKVYLADAQDVLSDCIADQSLTRFQLYFPDPWHKKKHQKRRIVQPEFVAVAARKLKPGGILHMATDWQDYAEQMLEVLSAEPLVRNTQTDYSPRPEFRPTTKFETRGERLGHGVWDLVFQKMQIDTCSNA
jgi:tRNA (guanine-N7-)-methyltransferase